MKPLYGILAGGLVLRLALVALPGFAYDQAAFTLWARTMATHGPLAMYAPGLSVTVDYPPGYLYVLWLVGEAHAAVGGGMLGWRILLKLVPIAADLVAIALVYVLARRGASDRAALFLTAVVAFAPPLWLDSALWGQSDSLPLALALAALVAALDGYALAGLPLLTAAILVKPQSVAIAPELVVLFARAGRGIRGFALGSVASLALAYAATVPFTRERAPQDVYRFLLDRYVAGVAGAPHTTNGAFNLYALISKFYAVDSAYFGPLPYRTWGLLLVLLALATILTGLIRALVLDPSDAKRTARVLGAASLSYLALFLFATRVHERYMLPALIVGAPLALEDRPTAVALVWLAFAFTTNCAFILVGFFGGGHHPITAYIGRGIALGNLIAFAVLWQRQWRRIAIGPNSGTWWRQGDSNS